MGTVDTPMTIPGLVAEVARRHPDQPAVVDGNVRITYAQLAEQVTGTARAYAERGLRRGDRAAVWAPNRLEFVLAVLGAQTIGAAVVPLNSRYRGHEAATILARSRAATLVLAGGFLGTDFLGMLRAAAAELPGPAGHGPVPGLPHLHTVVDLGAATSDGDVLSWAGFTEGGRGVDEDRFAAMVAAVTPDDICDIMFTSGTTGVPKGVLSAQRQTIDVARIWAERAGLGTGDRYAVVNPLFHGFGYKAGMIASLTAGTTIYPVAAFDSEALLELIQAERISVLPGPPTLFTSLLDHPRLHQYDTSSLRYSVAGAATVPRSLFRRMRDELGFDSVSQAYGLTEAVVVTQSRPGEDPEHLAETTGPPVEGMEVRIADPDGREVPAGEEGEVLIRGRNVMLGYFEDERATAAAIDAGGWFHSGDIGRVDEHGCLQITDRIKDMFTVGGFNVYPAEVENVLASHPDVSESAVVAKPDPRMGSVALAFVVPRRNATPSVAELIEYCRARLANFKVPREIVVRAELPKNASGKILKTELRAAQRA
ncbi:AMP-binding protein [Amycolatopsis viridis]|uniref:Acyl-CoA synthetase (AMP-forming)/AMP-acid ligase II n=1 Tax=Amycolatopsis viridis TaxID=185678 RepID=A0ABX0SV29_9PSEU|nr:AMP-binding protein [Amycolatopsis viridis]NIH80817.1 acyl-CoA synthetase (AMP-forming)/AMP-acid ligase II [Amycolatopsis viridis]